MAEYGAAILSEAKKWLSCKEISPNRSACVDALHKEFDVNWNGSPDAWCAKFVWVVVGNASKFYAVSNPAPHTAGALELLNQSRKAKIPVDKNPAPGCIFYKKSSGSTGHVGFVAQVNGNNFDTIEGNSSDMVKSANRTISDDMYFIHVEKMRKIYFKNQTYFLTFAALAATAGGGYWLWKLKKKKK